MEWKTIDQVPMGEPVFVLFESISAVRVAVFSEAGHFNLLYDNELQGGKPTQWAPMPRAKKSPGFFRRLGNVLLFVCGGAGLLIIFYAGVFL